jgi:hypothetical protein
MGLQADCLPAPIALATAMTLAQSRGLANVALEKRPDPMTTSGPGLCPRSTVI